MHDLKDTESFGMWMKKEFPGEDMEGEQLHQKRSHAKRAYEDGKLLHEELERLLGCDEKAGQR